MNAKGLHTIKKHKIYIVEGQDTSPPVSGASFEIKHIVRQCVCCDQEFVQNSWRTLYVYNKQEIDESAMDDGEGVLNT